MKLMKADGDLRISSDYIGKDGGEREKNIIKRLFLSETPASKMSTLT